MNSHSPEVADLSTPSISSVDTPIKTTPAVAAPATRASTSGSMRGAGISLADTLSGMSADDLDRELADIASLGVSMIRIDFDWSAIQHDSKDSYDWSRIDRTVAAARAHHLSVLPILVYTPAWARASGCSSNRCPPDSAAFAQFAQTAAKRYASEGIHAWEIWNEQNMAASWMPAADPKAYAALIKNASQEIRGVDPQSTIITGGLGPIDTSNGNIAPVDFVADLYAQGAQPYFDAIGMHPYSFPALPSDDYTWNAWQQMSATSPSIRSIMAAHGDSVKQIWMTEFGAPTNGPRIGATIQNQRFDQSPDHVDEALQAKMLYSAITLARNSSWAGPLFIYSYRDLGTSSQTTENFYGIIRADGSHKPAYDALKQTLASN